MSDEQTIYISPEDDLTTVRERLEHIPSRRITLVIPNQTQLRSHVAWKLLYARARELGKEVLIVSSDPQVRSVAHAVKFRVAHSLETTTRPGRSRSGSRAGAERSNAGTSRSRSTVPPVTKAKEPATGQGVSRTPRSARPSLPEQSSIWSEPDSPSLPEPVDPRQSHFDEPREPNKPHLARLNLPERPERNEVREERSSRYNQSYDFRTEVPPTIHPLPTNQIEEPDLLIEDYEQAQDIRQAASGSHPVIEKQPDSESGITPSANIDTHIPAASPNPANRSHQPTSQVYGDDDPFIYMADDSQPPSQPEQKGEAILEDDEIPQGYPSLQKSAISDLPTVEVVPRADSENRIEYRGGDDEDERIPPISPTPIMQARPRDVQFDAEDEEAQDRPSPMSPPPHPYSVRPQGRRSGTLPPAKQISEEEEQLPAFPERPAPMQVPQALPLPMPRAQSKPLAPTSKPLSSRTSGQMVQKAPTRNPVEVVPHRTNPGPTTRSGSRVPQSARSRPASRPGSAVGAGARRPGTANRLRRPRKLYLIVASIVALCIILFAALYLNTASTVTLTVATQDYAQSLKLTLSKQNQPGAVPATAMTHNFTKTAPAEPATGSTLQATNYATGIVNFTNGGTTPVEIPSNVVVATTNNIDFVTTEDVLILPQSTNPVTLPVSIRANNQGEAGNVASASITVIPQDSLTKIARQQSTAVTAESLKTTLTVSNPSATTGGGAQQVPAVTQQDLDNAKQDLHQQALADINTWIQQNAKKGLVGQAVTTDTLLNPPAVGTAEQDKSFLANISVTATILVAQLSDAQRVAASQLNDAVHADNQFGPSFAIIGGPQTINLDLAQQNAGDGNTVTVPATGKVGPNLNTIDMQNSIKGKSLSEAAAILGHQSQSVRTVDIQTRPGIFNWVSPWADHITVIVLPAGKKARDLPAFSDLMG